MCRYAEDLLPLTKIMAGPEQTRKLRLDDVVDVRRLRVFYMEVRITLPKFAYTGLFNSLRIQVNPNRAPQGLWVAKQNW